MNKSLQIKTKKNNCCIKLLFAALFLCSHFFCNNVGAANNVGYLTIEQINNIRVTVAIKNKPLDDIMKVIGRQSKLEYGFHSSVKVNANEKFSLSVTDMSVSGAMSALLKNSKYDYKIEKDRIIIINKTVKPTTQNREKATISGKIIDDKGDPIIGATILVEGTSEGAISDDSGLFKFSTYIGNVIEASFIGYIPQKYIVKKDETNMIIRLNSDIMSVEEVVVTGIYQRKKESFTGSSQTYTAGELKAIGNQNLIQSLKSLDPALNIIENNQFGSDPNRMPNMEIRGKSSIVGLKEEFGEDPNQPLFILDGFETTLSTIMDMSMDRVASVTILKDAASTAIYGSKAANGVIVVETRVPVQGKLRFMYNGNAIFQFSDLSGYNLMNSAEKLEFERRAGRFESNLATSTEDLDYRYNHLKNEIARGVDTYWLDEPIRLGINHRHGVTLEGGNNELRYGIGVDFNGNNGVMKKSKRDIVGGNIDLIYRNGKFSIANKMRVDYRMTDDPVVSFSEFSRTNPYYRKFTEDGSISRFLESNTGDKNAGKYKPSLYEVSNPMWNYMQSSYNGGTGTNINNNLNIEYRPISSVMLRARFGFTKGTDEYETFFSPEDTRFSESEPLRKGSYENSRSDSFSYEGDFTATYGNVFKEKHQINAVLGASVNENSSETKRYSSEGFPNGGFTTPSFANSYPTSGKPNYSDYKKRGANFYFNGGYSYDNRYLMDVNYRLDGASVFGSNKQFTTTWAVGLAWNLHNEKFIKDNTDIINLFKVRASVGNPGNQNFGSFQTITTYSFNNWMTNNFGTGVIVDNFGDNNLDWQKTLDKNIGIDLTILKNRFHINADYYDKITDPLLANIRIPLSIGTSTRLMNIGKQVSRGFNATIKYAIIYRPADRINWTVSLSMRNGKTFYDNIGENLNETNRDNLKTSLVRYYDKVSSTALWSVRSLGIDPASGKETLLTKDGAYTFDYTSTDEVIVGDTRPILDGVLSNSLRYKGFSMNFSIRYNFGGDAFNSTLYEKVENISSDGIKMNQDKRALYDRWYQPGDVARYKAINLLSSSPITSRFVQPNDYVSLESVRIGYDFETSFIKSLGLSNLSLSAYMNDIVRFGTMTAERGIDYPFARSISFSISFNF